MGEEKQFQRRSAMLVGLFVLCLLCFCGLLYSAHPKTVYVFAAKEALCAFYEHLGFEKDRAFFRFLLSEKIQNENT